MGCRQKGFVFLKDGGLGLVENFHKYLGFILERMNNVKKIMADKVVTQAITKKRYDEVKRY
jgi:hypothetical protein